MIRPFLIVVVVAAIGATCYAHGKEMLSPLDSMTDPTSFLLAGAALIGLANLRRRRTV